MSNTGLTPEQIAVLSHETKQPLATGLVLFFTIMASIFVVLRFITRFCIIKCPGFEDYVIGLAMTTSIAMAAIMMLEFQAGVGLHAMFLSMTQTEATLKYLYITIILYNICLMSTKFSLLMLYYRIFSFVQYRRAIYVIMAFLGVYGLYSTIMPVFTCIPVQAYWVLKLQGQPGVKCRTSFTIWYINAGLNIASDLLIASLPLPVIKSLQLQRKQKLALSCIFGIGWLAVVVSILRLNSLIVFQAHPDDPSWYGPEAAYWSAIEVNLGIICACLSTLKPLVGLVFPRFLATASRLTRGKSWPLSNPSKIQDNLSRSQDRIVESSKGGDEASGDKSPVSPSARASEWFDVEKALVEEGPAVQDGQKIKVVTDISQISGPRESFVQER